MNTNNLLNLLHHNGLYPNTKRERALVAFLTPPCYLGEGFAVNEEFSEEISTPQAPVEEKDFKDIKGTPEEYASFLTSIETLAESTGSPHSPKVGGRENISKRKMSKTNTKDGDTGRNRARQNRGNR